MEPGLRGDHFVFTDLETLSRFKHPSLFEVALLAATFGAWKSRIALMYFFNSLYWMKYGAHSGSLTLTT